MQKNDLEDRQKFFSSSNNPKQSNFNGAPRKRVKKIKENPFEDLLIKDSDDEHRSPNKVDTEWIKCQAKPLTISVVDHSRINRFYSHKSIQKYIKYLFAKNIPNPMWLSIKRQSQINHIIFMDIEIQNNIFYQHFRSFEPETQERLESSTEVLKFLSKFNLSNSKAYFKESRFLKDSSELWDATFVYDQQAVKEEAKMSITKQLCEELNQQTYKIYQTYLLTEEQRRANLYPFKQLPVYKDYYEIKEIKQIPLKNKILVVDCEMVMSYNNFQLARTSIMNFEGELIYDQFFKPDTLITSYNTQFSGITQQTLKNVSKKIKDLHEDLQKIMDRDTILIGHSLQNDLHAMKLHHERVIDTSVLFSRKNGSKMKLKTLAYNILNRKIQEGTHCSEEDCQATLDLVRRKIQASQCTPIENKNFHLLTQLQQLQKKVVIVDSDIEFIRHRKDYLGVHFEAAQFNENYREQYVPKIVKYFDKSVKNPDIIFSKIRKSGFQEWQQYYRGIDSCIEQIYGKCQEQSVFFLNFQVNNLIEIYPNPSENILQRRRPFCLIIVKNN